MINEETIKRFKDTVKRLMKKADYNPSGSPFDILVLNIRKREDRIAYCAYEKMVRIQFTDSLRFLGSPIKVIVRVPKKNREAMVGSPREKPSKQMTSRSPITRATSTSCTPTTRSLIRL